MQPIESNLSVGIPSIVGPEHPPHQPESFDALALEGDAELPPPLNALQQIIVRPDLHTVGDLAALTDRLTSEMMLFSALVGHPAAKNTIPDTAPCADAAQNELHLEFLRDLEA